MSPNSTLLASSTITFIAGQPQRPQNWPPCFHLCRPAISCPRCSHGSWSFWNKNQGMSLPCSECSNHFPSAFIKPGSFPRPAPWHPSWTHLTIQRHVKFQDGSLLQGSLFQVHRSLCYSLIMPSNFLPQDVCIFSSLWLQQFSPKFQCGSVLLHSDFPGHPV